METSNRLKRKAALSIAAASLLILGTSANPSRTVNEPPAQTTTEDTTKVVQPQPQDTIRKGKNVGTHRATWYNTAGHWRVHRDYPTAAYNMAPIGTKLLVKNLLNSKSCTVVVTDRMAKDKRKLIDLSHMAFGIIAEHGWGAVPVQITILD